MNHLTRLCAVALLVSTCASSAFGQFFIGAPSISASTTSGTLTNTLVAVPNQLTHEIDITGQLIVTNANPATQILTFDVTCALDPTYPAGNETLSISQSGYVDVPLLATATIYGWAIQAQVLDPLLNPVPGAYAADNQPIWPLGYGPGLGQLYGPTLATGPAFNYLPLPGQSLVLHFTSDFQGLTVPSTYVWDFPITVKFNAVPEPSSLALLGAGALLLARRCRN